MKLDFYADPDTWFATSLIADAPAGEINDDYRDTEDLGWKPGRTADDALFRLNDLLAAAPKPEAPK